ncbi:MAG: carboxypeptidase-like regulatory domain-containing protein, partial [Terriglobales bacterium]
MKNRQNEFAKMRTLNTASNRRSSRKLNSPSPADSSSRFGWFGAAAIHAAVFCFLALLFSVGACAQTTQGFTGLVTDSTGAVIPKAKVTVHNEATGVDKPVITTSTGNWTVPFLVPGIYDVRVEAAGFKSVDKTNITLSTGEAAEVNFTVVPGSVMDTVTVNASEDVLDYDKADVGNVMENQLLEQLPDFDNDTFNFAIFTPGMMTTTTGMAPGNQSAQTFTIHGASVEFSIDGVANISETGPEHYTMAPPSDSLQEFKITTSPVDAANGRAPSGQIDMTLKTGTKTLHGAAYEYLQRAFLNANTPQNDANIFKNVAAGASAATIAKYNKAAFTQNQYGFELDGPVIVPKLWNGKKQTFFMILYEDLHSQSIATSITSVPQTSAMANGDFSSLLGLTVNGAAYNEAIYDPTTEATCTAHNTDTGTSSSGHPAVCRYQYGYGPGAGAGPQGNPVLIGTPNVIPANEINPVAQAILSWYPAANQSPTPTTANPFNNNYVGLSPSINDNKSYIIKLDQNVGKNDTFGVTGKLWKFYGQNNNAFPRNNVNAAHPGLNEAMDVAHYNGTDYRYPSLNASWTHTFSPTLINSFRGLVTTALESDSTGPASGYDPSKLGFSSSIGAANPTYFQRFPLTNLSGYAALGAQAVLFRGDDEMQLIDTANWTRGNHVMKFGGEVRFAQYSQKSTNGTGFNL